ncbi:MAG: FHA domain-containing protein, partial [Armatimonadota bacterium]
TEVDIRKETTKTISNSIKEKKELAKARLTGASFIIGRSAECQLKLDDPLASKQHLEITCERGSFWLRDCESRNGTSLNGKKVTGRRELKHGDEIAIGGTRLRFLSQQTDGDVDDDATRPASELPGESQAGRKVVKKREEGSLQVKLRVTEGLLPGGVFEDWEGPLTIGRALDNHVVLANDDIVSTHHARIVQENDRYVIEDLDSSNGTFLNGVRIHRTSLANGAKIRIGKYTLVFDLVDVRRQRQMLRRTLLATLAVAVMVLLVILFKPVDKALEHIHSAERFEKQADYTNALREYVTALTIDSARSKAKSGKERVERALKAEEMLKQAEQSAAVDNYYRAKELCYSVLRSFPSNKGAKELESVIKLIEEAQIALTNQNWPDAERLLEKAREKQPKSDLISSRLRRAESESAAKTSLSRAKDSFHHEQWDMAESNANTVPKTSVYFTEARQLLDKIRGQRLIEKHFLEARRKYQEGQIVEALSALVPAMDLAPDEPRLVKLRERAREMQKLEPELKQAETLTAGHVEDVDALLQGRQACEGVLKLEEDTLNVLRKCAADTRDQINQNLKALSAKLAGDADNLLKSGDRKKALRDFDLAIKAEPGNQIVWQRADEIRKAIVNECKSYYQSGLRAREFQRYDEARKQFKSVLNIGTQGDEYYEKADKALKSLPEP